MGTDETVNETLYGWFSEKQAELYGTVIYVDSEGNEVEVTVVSRDPESSGCKWDDIKLVGKVVEYKRSGRKGSHHIKVTYLNNTILLNF